MMPLFFSTTFILLVVILVMLLAKLLGDETLRDIEVSIILLFETVVLFFIVGVFGYKIVPKMLEHKTSSSKFRIFVYILDSLVGFTDYYIQVSGNSYLFVLGDSNRLALSTVTA